MPSIHHNRENDITVALVGLFTVWEESLGSLLLFVLCFVKIDNNIIFVLWIRVMEVLYQILGMGLIH